MPKKVVSAKPENLSENGKKFARHLIEKWESGIVARCNVQTFSGGLITAPEIARRDHSGTMDSPPSEVVFGLGSVGRSRVCYETEGLALWIAGLFIDGYTPKKGEI